MKVRELIAELGKHDPEMEVCVFDPYDGPLEIEGVKFDHKRSAPDTKVLVL